MNDLEAQFDYYETPKSLVKKAIQIQAPFFYGINNALDVCSGKGVWGQTLKEWKSSIHVTGIDINPDFYNFSFDDWITGDFLTHDFGEQRFDFIFGNPLYTIHLGNKDDNLAEKIIRKSLGLLTERGKIYFLLKTTYVDSIKRRRGLFNEFPISIIFQIGRVPFVGYNNSSNRISYAMYEWDKEPPQRKYIELRWFPEWKVK